MIVEDELNYAEYVEIMSTTGWKVPSERLIKRGLKNSINVKYVINKEIVGMARIITDYGLLPYL